MFNRIADCLAGIGVDKYIHFNACLFIAFAVSVVMSGVAGVYAAAVAGFVLSVGIGYVKERTDRRRTGFDKADMAADAIGALAGCLMGLVGAL